MKKKSLALVLALAMIVVCVVGGTLAWLTATTSEVKNTFTYGDIDITLAETKTDFKMIPGYTIAKDPKVTVQAGSEDCYLFVKVEESTNLKQFISYTVDNGWTALTGVDGVYYRVVNASAGDQTFSVLAGDKVTVNSTVTKAMLNGLNADGAIQPTLTFTAYAVQLNENNTTEFTPAQAWAKVNPPTT